MLQLSTAHRSRGHKFFELSNHLGNVLAVISDRHLGPDPNADGIADHYRAQVTSARDYWAFGLELHGRTWAAGAHRYGFNGKENDRSGEWGTGFVQDYGFRLYAPAIGKFLSVDPLRGDYPELTCYQFASNTPISGIDLDGLEYFSANEALIQITSGKVKLYISNWSEIMQKSWNENAQKTLPCPESPVYGCLGLSTTIGTFNFDRLKFPQNAQLPLVLKNAQSEELYDGIVEELLSIDPGLRPDVDPTKNAYNTPMGTPRNNDGTVDKRYKRYLRVNANGGIPSTNNKNLGAIAAFVFALDCKIMFYNYQSATNIEDFNLNFNNQIDKLGDVVKDLNKAMRLNKIPSKYMNSEDLSCIANFILFGELGRKDEVLMKTAINICKQVSGNYQAQPSHFNQHIIPSGLDNYPAKTIETPKF